MKKKVLLVLLALALVFTMAACDKPETSSTPVSSTPVESSTAPVVSSTPVESTPVESTPVESTPVESTPVESTPVSSTPVSSTPVSSTPASSAPVSSAPVSSAPVSSAPAASSTPKPPVANVIGSNPDFGLPQKITIVQQMVFGDTTENLEQKALWMDTLSARYGVDIILEVTAKADTATIYASRLAGGDLTGIVYTYGWDRVYEWYGDGIIYPLDDMLKNNATWNSLPKAMTESFKFAGQTWCFPNGWSAGISSNLGYFAQAIRLDWMTKLGFEDTGYTMDTGTFKTIIRAFGDRKAELLGDKTIPIIFTGGQYGIAIIMSAFDAWVFDPNSSQAYTYNPDTNAFEDALLRDGARSGIEYIRSFYVDGYCPKGTFDSGSFADIRAQLTSARIGSFSMYNGRYREGSSTVNALMLELYGTTNAAAVGDGYTDWINLTNSTWLDVQLTGLKEKNLWANGTQVGGYVLMKGTPQPEETANFFVDLMYSSEPVWFESAFNLLDVAYVKESDGTYTQKYFDEAAGKYYTNSTLVGYVNPDMYPQANYTFFAEGTDKTTAIKRGAASKAYNATLTAAALASGRLFSLPETYKTIQYQSETYAKYRGEIDAFQTSFIYDGFIKSSVTVDKLFETYKKNMRSVNGQKVLDEANAMYNWTNDYQTYD